MTELEQEYNYTPLDKPLRITEHNWPEGTVPLVSITCTTYNHVNFIRDAIECFLMQETTFPVEILIHDDASPDGTAEIVRDYEARYPQLIKVIYQTENQFSKGNKPFQILRPLQCGKYIAFCEGDDYWTDSKKLEIQVGYLEDHSECVISGHSVISINEHGNQILEDNYSLRSTRDYTSFELQKGVWLGLMPLTWVFRNVLPIEPIPERLYIHNGDNLVLSLLGQFGGSKYHSEISPGCYRHHLGGIWSMKPNDIKQDDHINTYFWIYRYYKRVGNHKLTIHWKTRWQKKVTEGLSFRFLAFELAVRIFYYRQSKAKIRRFLASFLEKSGL